MRKKIDLESLYLRLPHVLQNLVVSLEGRRIRKRRYNAAFFLQLAKVKTDGDLSPDALNVLREERLLRFLLQAVEVPFWQKRLGALAHLKTGQAADFVQSLPLLLKDEVKVCTEQLINPVIPKSETIISHTSGTTGSGLIFPVTRAAEQTQWAVWWRYRQWHGIGLDTWCGYFGGRSLVPLTQQKPPYWRVNRPGKQLMFSAYHLSESTAGDYIAALNRYGVPWLHGYPSTIALLAGLKLDLALPDLPSLRVVTTGAESLLPQQKRIIARAFHVPVREHYGQAEGVANISECPEGKLHVDEDFSFVEFIPIEGVSDEYRIVGTNWSNPAFPLLRYDTGDIATLDHAGCGCGRPGRVVKAIDGRKEDYVVLPSGARVGRLDHIFKDMTRIWEAQIYQPHSGKLVFRVVRGQGYDIAHDESALLREARRRLGTEIEIEVQYLREIPKTKTGKLRFVLSDLTENKVQ